MIVHRSAEATSCPDQAELLRAIDRVGKPVRGTSSTGPLTLDVSFDVQPGGNYRAVIIATGRKHGRRVLMGPGPACEPLTDALAVTLALLMDREIVPRADSPPADDTKPPTEPDKPPGGSNDAEQDSHPERSKNHEKPSSSKRQDEKKNGPKAKKRGARSPSSFRTSRDERGMSRQRADHRSSSASIRIDTMAGWGTPGADWNWNFGADVEWEMGNWQWFAGGYWMVPQATNYAGGEIDVSLVGGRAGACWAPWKFRDGFFRLWSCGQIGLGRLQGTGKDYFINRRQSRPWYSMAAFGRLEARLVGPVRWGLRLGAMVTLQRESFSIDGAGTGYETSAVGFFGGPDVEVSFF